MSELTLQELIRGKGAHADPLACVEDLSAELAGKRIAGYPHSIWQILGHVNYWIEYDLKRVAGERPPYPEHAIESWPKAEAPADEREWQAEVARFSSWLERLTELASSAPDRLDRQVEILHPQQATRSSTVRAVLWQTVAHNSYHIGQIALLRRSLGAWPARGGGDTW
jgi:uncharacterized damage-inducible protein DinB